jgi:hypothetical protein
VPTIRISILSPEATDRVPEASVTGEAPLSTRMIDQAFADVSAT